jgi:predicted DNA-binding protein YlxM (UPF0122 family)
MRKQSHKAKIAQYRRRRAHWRRLIDDGYSMAEIARRYSISRQAVRSALNGGVK